MIGLRAYRDMIAVVLEQCKSDLEGGDVRQHDMTANNGSLYVTNDMIERQRQAIATYEVIPEGYRPPDRRRRSLLAAGTCNDRPDDMMSDDEKLAWAKMLREARRLRMVHSLADRQDEADKMRRLIEELESLGKARGWSAPE